MKRTQKEVDELQRRRRFSFTSPLIYALCISLGTLLIWVFDIHGSGSAAINSVWKPRQTIILYGPWVLFASFCIAFLYFYTYQVVIGWRAKLRFARDATAFNVLLVGGAIALCLSSRWSIGDG